jgi:hypothetical protein
VEAKPVAAEARPAEARPAVVEAKPAAPLASAPAEAAPAPPVLPAAPAEPAVADGGNSGMKPSGEPSWASPGDWDELTERIGPPRRSASTPPASTPTVKGFAPALAPPDALADAAPAPEVRAQVRPSTSPPNKRYRPPTEPEIETYLEMEAELPPGTPDEPAPIARASGSAPRIAHDDDDDHPEISITIEDDSTRVTETVTETDFLTLTVTVTESVGESVAEAPVAELRPRRTTADKIISGTIEDAPPGAPPATQAPRAKRHSGGWDE